MTRRRSRAFPRSQASVVAALGLALLGLASPVAGQSQSRISTGVDTTVVTVGDRITLEVSVDHPAGSAVVWPDSLDLGAFEVLDARVTPTRTRGDAATSSARFSLAAFELGTLEIPSLRVRVLHADGREEPLESDRFGVEVVSVGVDESGEIREIRGPLALPVGIVQIGVWLLVLALVAAAFFVWARRLRRGDGDGVTSEGPPPRPPHEVALEELERLEASGLLTEGRVKDYHVRASDIIRRYVEARFRVPALEMTTWEVLGGLQAARAAEPVRSELRSYLGACDMVKFAKAEPGLEASRALIDLGRSIVMRSMPPGAAGNEVTETGAAAQEALTGEAV